MTIQYISQPYEILRELYFNKLLYSNINNRFFLY